MATLVIGLSIVAMIWAVLLLIGVLLTAIVVARIAAHLRDDSWARITAQHGALRRREEHLTAGRVHDREREQS